MWQLFCVHPLPAVQLYLERLSNHPAICPRLSISFTPDNPEMAEAPAQVPLQDATPTVLPLTGDDPVPAPVPTESGETFTIPTECKAGVIYNVGPDFEIKVEMVPVPQIGPTDLLVKINCTGICYSDVHYMLGDLEGVPPMSFFGVRSPGHEGAGVVVKVGTAVKEWKVGDRAGIKPMLDVCGNCDTCWAGKENHCPNATHTGLMATGKCDDVQYRKGFRLMMNRNISAICLVTSKVYFAYSRGYS